MENHPIEKFCRIDRLDADKSGVIEADELKNALRAVGQHPMQLGELSWESKGMPRPPKKRDNGGLQKPIS